ncbi:flagellar basal body P-ring formation chaperone FlgA [Pseudoalteromonas aliena]|uniref:Flagella basal body P-ring formation protein FlgA n=1 Tax=Pseudoalteromonas aliena SW19 TaxID=1314866 RepID=A0ABR9E398_9GAMM|nr:flagellar basal body P-ring formation chaperone FlgA [Pseudoalteromonas aliena]MBE0359904.1 flagella basal body P-ring formation protein FlgA [Pseudoalteromonas aliena SW19]
MTYIKNNLIRQYKAEAKLPQGKYVFFRMFFILVFFSTQQSVASNINFDKQIHTYLQKEIDSYLASTGSNKQQQKIKLFIPKGSTDLNCENVLISRSKKEDPPAGRISLTVQCESPKWKFRASAKVNLWIDLVAAKRNLSRGELLTADLLHYKSADVSKHLHSTEAKIKPLVGMTVKREIKKDDIISRRHLENMYLVNKDEFILLQVNTASFSANVKAVALQDGQFGEIINVKNLSSNKVVQGKVIDKRVVEAIF